MPQRLTSQEHGTSQRSTLPLWDVKRGEKRGTLNIRCPRKDCEGKAVVSRSWLTCSPHIGRSCTYCFKTARVPSARVPS